MPWYVLLIVALVSLAVIIGALVHVALKGWRVAKHGMAVSRRITPLADGLSRRADEITAAAERLSADGESLTGTSRSCRARWPGCNSSSDTLNEAMRAVLPPHGVAGGRQGYNDWRRWSREHPR